MRSPIGPVLVLIGLATTVVLVLLLVQTMGLRSDLEAARAEVDTLRAEIESASEGLSVEELRAELDELEAAIVDALGSSEAPGAGDPSRPAGGSGSADERLDEILDRIEALDRRVTEICENVPVC